MASKFAIGLIGITWLTGCIGTAKPDTNTDTALNFLLNSGQKSDIGTRYPYADYAIDTAAFPSCAPLLRDPAYYALLEGAKVVADKEFVYESGAERLDEICSNIYKCVQDNGLDPASCGDVSDYPPPPVDDCPEGIAASASSTVYDLEFADANFFETKLNYSQLTSTGLDPNLCWIGIGVNDGHAPNYLWAAIQWAMFNYQTSATLYLPDVCDLDNDATSTKDNPDTAISIYQMEVSIVPRSGVTPFAARQAYQTFLGSPVANVNTNAQDMVAKVAKVTVKNISFAAQGSDTPQTIGSGYFSGFGCSTPGQPWNLNIPTYTNAANDGNAFTVPPLAIIDPHGTDGAILLSALTDAFEASLEQVDTTDTFFDFSELIRG